MKLNNDLSYLDSHCVKYIIVDVAANSSNSVTLNPNSVYMLSVSNNVTMYCGLYFVNSGAINKYQTLIEPYGTSNLIISYENRQINFTNNTQWNIRVYLEKLFDAG